MLSQIAIITGLVALVTVGTLGREKTIDLIAENNIAAAIATILALIIIFLSARPIGGLLAIPFGGLL